MDALARISGRSPTMEAINELGGSLTKAAVIAATAPVALAAPGPAALRGGVLLKGLGDEALFGAYAAGTRALGTAAQAVEGVAGRGLVAASPVLTRPALFEATGEFLGGLAPSAPLTPYAGLGAVFSYAIGPDWEFLRP